MIINLRRTVATTAMTHIAIQEQLDGKAVDWMEKVSDEQYLTAIAAAALAAGKAVLSTGITKEARR